MTNQVDSKSWTENRLTSGLGLQCPIIQGPLGGLSSQRSRPPLLVGSLEDLPAASRTACSMNSTKRIQRSCLTHFNVHSCGISIPAEKAGRPELLPLWAGQSANLSRCADVHALLDTLVNEVSEIGSAVKSWSAHRQLASAQVGEKVLVKEKDWGGHRVEHCRR
jgi:hypothetical protein